MSADNWAVCPRCRKRHEVERAAKIDAVAAAYGKVPMEEYEEQKALLAAELAEGPYTKCEFREDYEIYGAAEGTIFVSYSGHCKVCNLGLDFSESKPFYNAADDA